MAAESSSGDPNDVIRISVADLQFVARLERGKAPKTCDAFLAVLPFRSKLLQARWSGESAWIPLRKMNLGVTLENATGKPAAGEILFHPADHSECEILFPYGKTIFRCKDGELSGSHFLTIVKGIEQLPKMGELVLQHGAQDIIFSRCGG